MNIIISHRGNLNGPDSRLENNPDYIQIALNKGFDVEVDVWCIDGLIFLGHDEPLYCITMDFFRDKRLWIHCKDYESMNVFSEDFNAISHTDGIVITKYGYLWTAPGLPIMSRSIAVMPELSPNWNISKAIGVCTDYPSKYCL